MTVTRVITKDHTIYPFLFDAYGQRLPENEIIKKLKSLSPERKLELQLSSVDFATLVYYYRDQLEERKTTGDSLGIQESVSVQIK
jgi:hypothetical protein